ncbi:hypothetical protein ACH5RR_011767 [Cinchona calisaya]|uniref:ZF-HD dimerization-type domain-containing protein n=1 Tax=Cinchona calisaya TaxID=153742 RepID=A0ABD3A8E1_9GENT
MEPRGQEKDHIGLPYSIGYNLPPFNNQTSAKLPSAPSPDIRRNEASQTLYTNKDSNPDPDPAKGTNAGIPSASESKTTPPQLPPTSGANTSSSARYHECLKNHAANMGGHVIDGCGEFMPSGMEGTQEALRCAACDCHRNFHRKEGDGTETAQAGTSSHYVHNQTPTPRHNNNTAYNAAVFRTQPPQIASLVTMPASQQQHKFTVPMAPMMMAFGGNSGGAGAESSSEDLNMLQCNNAGGQAVMQQTFSLSKKRFRTKFTQQQKDRMHELAEKLGWKIQKQDEQEVQQLCNEVRVKRQVFKVWMHNNKQAMKKKEM